MAAAIPLGRSWLLLWNKQTTKRYDLKKSRGAEELILAGKERCRCLQNISVRECSSEPAAACGRVCMLAPATVLIFIQEGQQLLNHEHYA
jgi:hypothetical protein